MTADEKHLWEHRHAYHCEMQNYRARASDGCSQTYESWTDFIGEWNFCDMDYNLLFRWDWLPASDADGEPIAPVTGNGGELRVCFMLQRKGDYRCATVLNMREEDEAEVREYLTKHAKHMRMLWAPLL